MQDTFKRYIPLKPSSKDPLVAWSNPDNRYSTIEDLQTNYPNANVAMCTGKGLIVLDIDNKHGKKGSDSLKDIPGFQKKDLDTHSVATPNNGMHYYYTTDIAISNKTGLKEGIDIRGNGGYVVVPPSKIDNKEYTIISEGKIKPIPQWLLSLLEPKDKVCSSKVSGASPGSDTEFLPDTPLAEVLKSIDPNCSYEEWRNVIWSAIEAYGHNQYTVDTLEHWSKQSDKYNSEDFNKVVNSFDQSKVSGNPVARLKAHSALTPTGLYSLSSFLGESSGGRIGAIGFEQISSLAKQLAQETAKHALTLIKRYGNKPTEEHIRALETVANCLAYNGFTTNKSRIAIPLYTGGGKTLSIAAYLAQIYGRGIDLGVWVATGTIEQLNDLREKLIKNGIPEQVIGIKHSRIPKGKKEKATAVTEDNAHQFQFILVTHQRIKACDIDYLLQYKGKPRQLIWDEALIATKGVSLSVKKLLDSISCWRNAYRLREKRFEYGNITPLHEATNMHLEAIEQAIEAAEIGDRIQIPEKEFRLALDWHKDSELETLDEVASGTARIVRDIGDKSAVMSFIVEVPDQLEKVCILDASAPIKQLMHYDKSIEVIPIEVSKDYSNVTLHVCRAYAGRTTVSDPNKNTPLYEEIAHVIENEIPESGDVIVFGLPDRQGEEDPEQRLRRFLSIGAKSKFQMVSWGRAKGINTLAKYSYGTHIGIPYRDKNELAASINGQRRDLENTVTNKEVFDTQASEHIDQIYQAISRLACRKTIDGKADKTDFWLFYPDNQVVTGLKKLMPGLNIQEYKPKYLEAIGGSTEVTVSKIISYLTDTAVQKVSINKLRKDLDLVHIKPHGRQWQEIKQALEDRLGEIGYTIAKQSIVPM